MTFQVLTPDGRLLTVSTHVGEGLARVVVQESKPDETPMEGTE